MSASTERAIGAFVVGSTDIDASGFTTSNHVRNIADRRIQGQVILHRRVIRSTNIDLGVAPCSIGGIIDCPHLCASGRRPADLAVQDAANIDARIASLAIRRVVDISSRCLEASVSTDSRRIIGVCRLNATDDNQRRIVVPIGTPSTT